ncbi:DNA-directed RNA polymerase I subunit rpa49 [Camellia lanceoleosa]|uniref:DNA-directed RNA polymerase I subunit rpa49 n=1 Tax=Camellia lanceoleosa TaxID=1840588 RepID=A0ACC0F8Z5_9ERIC|nr:DNA-directed RNA polymerase I subunit rpa49 [Camellia lanceoleosa]
MAKTKLYKAEESSEEVKPETTIEEDEEGEEENKREKKKKKMKKKKENIHVKKIETFSEHPDKIAPLVGYFPSGFDPLKEESSTQEQPKVRVFRHENRTKRLQLVVSPNGSQVNFVGTNYSGEATAPQLCNYALGVLDKESQTLKIVPIASNKIFRLEPIVAGSDSYEKEPSKEELRVEERADKIRELKRMYSTLKSVKQDKKRQTLYRKENPETQEELDRKIEGIKINKEALESVGSHNARNVPPHDTSATTPQMAYPVDMIIFAGEWDYLGDILELLHVGAEVAPNVYPSFVYNRFHKLERIKDEVERTTLACVFSYITHLIKFKDKHSSEGSSSAKHHKIPSILVQKFSTMFANSESKWLTDEKKDLLISYVLVLTLIADGFQTYPSDIAKDLRMTTMNVRQHYQNLGCKFVRKGISSVATLPVPLQFPKVVQKRRR